MEPPIADIPNPDDLVEEFVKTIFGPAALITIAFLALKSAWSWYELAKSGVKVTKATLRAASHVSNRLRTVTAVAISAAVVISLTLVMLQALWLWIAYLIGNALSYLVFGPIPDEGPEWDKVMASLRWDEVSTGYVVASILGFFIMYVAAFKGREASWVPTLLSFPAILWGFFCAIGSALALLLATLHRISDGKFEVDPAGKAMMLMALMALIQIVACYSVMGSPSLMVRIWRSLGAVPLSST
ncbi:hypothetical protein [Saccharothrix sp. NRRL B-16314]|uniref:hypothetical protein n=1 Tax=Saccharothrix sp. NRRL B-16314 TaxID=1463825 RepID=UPI0012DC2D12|nr:hypothetical protein [Saccharothrix sp. NRRL B-16314]